MVRELEPGSLVEATFAVTRKVRRSRKDGRAYLDIELADRSGRVRARVWEAVCEGRPIDARCQAEMRGVAALATTVALDVVSESFRYCGGEAMKRANVLGRCLRDMNAAATASTPVGVMSTSAEATSLCRANLEASAMRRDVWNAKDAQSC